MNTLRKTSYKLLMGALPVAIASWLPPLIAQDDDSEDVFELSPFSVDSSGDIGYQATNTLAGTRIKTQLKDLGASISVVTEEFMDDVAATDSGTLLSYISNAEVGGMMGNFAGETDSQSAEYGGNGSSGRRGRYIQNAARTDPQNNTRIRGLGTADLTRGFFLTDIPFDSYNTGRVTVSRGPNSLLFGIGSPGGVINNMTNQALHGRDFGEFSFRVDNYDSIRATLDYNKNLIEDRLAVRISLLEETQKYKQRPAYQDQTRVYVAADAVLAKNEGVEWLDATRLKINFEDGKQNGSPPEVIPPHENYHGWFEPIPASVAQFTGSLPDLNNMAPSDGGTWQFQALNDRPFTTGIDDSGVYTNTHPTIFKHVGVVFGTPGAGPDLALPGFNLQGYTGVVNWEDGPDGLQNAYDQLDTLDSTGLAGTPLAIDSFGADAPGDTLVREFRMVNPISPYSEPWGVASFIVPTLQNREVFDYHNQIFSNGTDRISREFDAQNFALEQSFFNNKAGIEVAYDKQYYETHQDFFFAGADGTSKTGAYDLGVDINPYLPNGELNPHLGRAYLRVRSPRQRFRTTDRETLRATAFAEVDFGDNEGILKHLGNHRFTGMYNDYTRDVRVWDIRDGVSSNSFDIRSAQEMDLGQGRRWVNPIVYVSDSLLGVQSTDDVRLNAVDIQRYNDGDAFNYIYADTTESNSRWYTEGMPGDRTIREGAAYVDRFLQTDNIFQNKIEATAFAWQSYFLDDHIVGLYGIRDDDTETFNRAGNAEAGVPQRLADISWNPEYTRLSTSPSLVESGRTTTWSVIGRYPEKWLGELPGGMDIQAHLAKSENFNPIGARNSPLGDPIGQPTGTTEEHGLLFGFAEGKYSVKLNWFETKLVNENAGLSTNVAGSAIGRINALRGAQQQGLPWSDQTTWVGDNYPITSYDQAITAFLATIPQRAVDVFQPVQVDIDGDGQWDEYEFSQTVPNIQGTSDRAAEGFEIELTANPMPGWRLMANISKQQTIRTDTANLIAELSEAYVNAVQSARLDELETDSFRGTDSEPWSTVLEGALLGPVRQAKALDDTVSQEQREWRLTAVSNYEFQEGKFRGVGFGGAVRWEDEAATGYVFALDQATGVPLPDVSRPFLDDGLFSGDAWVSYQRKIMDDKVDWSVKLNVRNLVGDDDDIPVKTNPDGNIAVVRIPNPRTIYFTNTFKF